MTQVDAQDARRPGVRRGAPRPQVKAVPRTEFGYVVVHESGRGAVAWIRGDLDVSAAPILLQRLIETLNLPLERLTLDMAEVRDIDGHGVAALVAAHKRAGSRKITLVLDAVPDVVRDAARHTDLASL